MLRELRQKLAARIAPGGSGGAGAATGEPRDYSSAEQKLIERVQPYSMTTPARLIALADAVRHVSRERIDGAFAECGVWRGGSVLAMLLALAEEGESSRDVYLYDTFEGMTEPTEADTSRFEIPALQSWREAVAARRKPWESWFQPSLAGVEAVREVVASSGYPLERIRFVEGPVEETIPGTVPDRLALLRLDTDWYESTRHELIHLYPRLAPGGVLIIDDYGHWDGCRRAVDEYFAEHGDRPLLNRIDYTGRLAIKPG